jgi:hypothetical protein
MLQSELVWFSISIVAGFSEVAPSVKESGLSSPELGRFHSDVEFWKIIFLIPILTMSTPDSRTRNGEITA